MRYGGAAVGQSEQCDVCATEGAAAVGSDAKSDGGDRAPEEAAVGQNCFLSRGP